MDKEEILDSLLDVIDPELGVNIVDLGLVYQVDIAENGEVMITMTLTTPGCPMHDSIVNGVKNRLLQEDPIKEVNVNLVWGPAWNPSFMSMDAKKELFGNH